MIRRRHPSRSGRGIFPPRPERSSRRWPAGPYPFRQVYRARDYLAILATQSSTHALGEARRADFLARVHDRLESRGWPELTATFVAYLVIRRRSTLSLDPAPGGTGDEAKGDRHRR